MKIHIKKIGLAMICCVTTCVAADEGIFWGSDPKGAVHNIEKMEKLENDIHGLWQCGSFLLAKSKLEEVLHYNKVRDVCDTLKTYLELKSYLWHASIENPTLFLTDDSSPYTLPYTFQTTFHMIRTFREGVLDYLKENLHNQDDVLRRLSLDDAKHFLTLHNVLAKGLLETNHPDTFMTPCGNRWGENPLRTFSLEELKKSCWASQ